MGESKTKQDHLKTQDASSVDPSKLTALTPDVVSFILYFTPLQYDFDMMHLKKVGCYRIIVLVLADFLMFNIHTHAHVE